MLCAQTEKPHTVDNIAKKPVLLDIVVPRGTLDGRKPRRATGKSTQES
jgi:hypothetical protein